VAALGFTAATFIFVASFFGMTIDKLGTKAFVLHLGIFVLYLPSGPYGAEVKGNAPS
jgi:hypothetical protein